MEAKGLVIQDLDDQVLKEFVRHLEVRSCCSCVSLKKVRNGDIRAGAGRFLAHLRSIRVVPETSPKADLPESLVRFEQWLLTSRGLKAATLRGYRLIILQLLRELGDPAGFTLEALRRFVSECAVHAGPKAAKRVLTGLKAFLRFLAHQGQCEAAWVDGIPTIAHWRLASLPPSLAPEEIERILSAPDLSRPIGLRDRAILLFLARLGLRAGDIIRMHLEDIDWASGTFAIHGKERRPGRLPLPQEVGDALLAYLAKGRPKVLLSQVFLRVRPPFGPFRDSSSISDVVFFAAKAAGVTLPAFQAAHALRHSLATRMVRSGVPFPVVQTVLRHRGGDTTAAYAKVDLTSLRKIAQPWPMEVGPC
jgi:integrase